MPIAAALRSTSLNPCMQYLHGSWTMGSQSHGVLGSMSFVGWSLFRADLPFVSDIQNRFEELNSKHSHCLPNLPWAEGLEPLAFVGSAVAIVPASLIIRKYGNWGHRWNKQEL